jgi:hypothetical protein
MHFSLIRQLTTGNRVFAVRRKRTAKEKKRPAKPFPYVFPENARQRAHDTDLHSKQHLPCALYRDAQQRLFVMRFPQRTAKKTVTDVKGSSRQDVLVCCAPYSHARQTFS